IDNFTNSTIGNVSATINCVVVKSTYRAIRQFLNSDSKENKLVINGGVVEGVNKGIFFHDPSKKANKGTLTIAANASVNSAYLFVTAGSTEWPVEVSIAESAMTGEVTSANVPEGYSVVVENGFYVVKKVSE
ncbi:MAG: hypothetical protein J6R28_00565, partial [Bacteroides sp.]|nr:hypothetical protein [Bacteroides sp.]